MGTGTFAGKMVVIVDVEQDLSANPRPAMGTFHDALVNQTLAVSIKEGRVCVNARAHGLKVESSQGFGSHLRLGDFRHLAQVPEG